MKTTAPLAPGLSLMADGLLLAWPGRCGLIGRVAVLLGMLLLCQVMLQAQESGSKGRAHLLKRIPSAEAEKGEVLDVKKQRTLYYMDAAAQVERKWRAYLKQTKAPAGRVQVVFYVNAKGGVENVRVVNDRPPPPILTDVTLRAVRDADIPPIPAEVIPTLKAEDNGRMKISMELRVKPDTQPQKEEETPKSRYIRNVVAVVEEKWHHYAKHRAKELNRGSLKIIFYLNTEGKVKDLRVVDDKKSNPVLNEITLQAIRDAEIPPMPADVIPLLPKDPPGRLKIEYNALIY